MMLRHDDASDQLYRLGKGPLLMTHAWSNFLLAQSLIWLPLALGWWVRHRGFDRPQCSRWLYWVQLVIVFPPSLIIGLWRVERDMPGWIWVPLLYGVLMLLATVFGVLLAKRLESNRERQGALVLLFPMSNIGNTLGGALTLLLLSSTGYCYAVLLMIPWLAFTFIIWIPMARHWQGDGTGSFWRRLLENLCSSYAVPVVCLLAGIGLNISGAPAPGKQWDWLLKVSVYGGTIMVMFAIGLNMHFRRVGAFRRQIAWVSLFKFLLIPLIAWVLCALCGVTGLPLAVLTIAAVMPAGVYCIALATLFDLDVDTANAGYIGTTVIFMTIVLPILILVLRLPVFA